MPPKKKSKDQLKADQIRKQIEIFMPHFGSQYLSVSKAQKCQAALGEYARLTQNLRDPKPRVITEAMQLMGNSKTARQAIRTLVKRTLAEHQAQQDRLQQRQSEDAEQAKALLEA